MGPLQEVSSTVCVKLLRKQFEQAWCRQTTYIADFDPEIPSTGQCYVTAMCVQDILGGELVEGSVDGVHHFWNRINGKEYDLTSDQFKGGDGFHPLKRRTYWCTRSNVNRKNRRYLLLKKRIRDA